MSLRSKMDQVQVLVSSVIALRAPDGAPSGATYIASIDQNADWKDGAKKDMRGNATGRFALCPLPKIKFTLVLLS